MTRDGRRPSRRRVRWGGVPLLALLAGCTAEGDYVVWPEAVETGDTVAILFNTEADTAMSPEGALLDAGVQNVVVQVSDSTGFTQPVAPRFVIEAPAALGSRASVAQGLQSWTGLVAVFDLPSPWPNAAISFPDVFDLQVEYEGVPTAGSSQLAVLGEGGMPMAFSPTADPADLQLQPMLRLRPAWDGAVGEGFDPSWQIGGLELTLRYTPGAGDVSGLRALGNGEAAGGLASATPLPPQGGDKRWRVVLLHPEGFQLPQLGCTAGGECFAGRWSLLDLPLEADATGVPDGAPVFVPADFAIEDLTVYDVEGEMLAVSSPSEIFFHAYAASNTMALPEPGLVLLLTSGVLGLVVLHRIERRRERRRGGRVPTSER